MLCDVDGVLYPLPELFTPYAAERLGRDLSLDTTNWEFYTEWGLGYDDFVELLGEGVRERKLWWTGAPYPDVTPAIARIRAAGHRIHVVTAVTSAASRRKPSTPPATGSIATGSTPTRSPSPRTRPG